MKKILLSLVVTFLMVSTAKAEEYTVKMVSDWDNGKYYFEPKELTIKSGDTVTWLNVTEDMHNAVSDSVPKGAENFESPMLEEVDQKWSYTFNKGSGTYSYHCHPHAAMGMRGSIIVDHPSKPYEIEKSTDGHDHNH